MHRPHRQLWPLLAVLMAVLATASPAAADYRDVYEECESGRLSTKFSASELKQASQRMSSYLRDYTNCSDAIYQAQTSAGRNQADTRSGGGNGGTTGNGSGGGTTTGSGGSGSTGAGGGAGTGGGATGTGGGPSAPGAPAGLTPDEQYIATQAATGQADAAGSLEQMLASAKVPSSALTYSSASTSMPLPLIVALGASAVLAVLAAVLSLLARFRRTRVG